MNTQNYFYFSLELNASGLLINNFVPLLLHVLPFLFSSWIPLLVNGLPSLFHALPLLVHALPLLVYVLPLLVHALPDMAALSFFLCLSNYKLFFEQVENPSTLL